MIRPQDMEMARQTIQKTVYSTPLVTSDSISAEVGRKVYLKLENLQKTGSFKLRGACYKISKLASTLGVKGIVAASAGNHAQGVALAASSRGIPVTIVMPHHAPLSKQLATRGYGGKVVLRGESFEEAEAYARDLEKEGLTMIHPFDDEDIITGQGTIGLEVMEVLPDLDTIIVPIGGGGLISGISMAVKEKKPDVQVIGVESRAAASAFRSKRKAKIVQVKPMPSIADGIAVKSVGQITYPIIQRYVDEVVVVEEDEIAAAILMLMERKRIVAEGAGAVTLAALLREEAKIKGSSCVLVISGGNIDVNLIDRIIAQGLAKTGRIVRIAVNLRDVPGSLTTLSRIIAAKGANILHIHHDRISKGIPIGASKVILELETAGVDHIGEILGKLREEDYTVEMG
jgi:threonine dehydratase